MEIEFLGWYDNPEFEIEPITKIETTDSGNKYSMLNGQEVLAEIIVVNEY